MNSPVITGSGDETIEKIAERMSDCKVGSVVILEGHESVGIVTQGDIVSKVVAKNSKPSEVLVKNVMSGPLITISDEEDVTDASRLMRKNEVKRLGVVDNGRLMGIISLTDVVSVAPEIYAIVAEKARMMASKAMGRTVHLAGVCDSCTQWSDDLASAEGKYLCYDCRAETVVKPPDE